MAIDSTTLRSMTRTRQRIALGVDSKPGVIPEPAPAIDTTRVASVMAESIAHHAALPLAGELAVRDALLGRPASHAWVTTALHRLGKYPTLQPQYLLAALTSAVMYLDRANEP